MKIPRTLTLPCTCGGEQILPLSFDLYESVLPDARHRDFVYCPDCQAPLAFDLPIGLAKRVPDRYSALSAPVDVTMALAG